MKKGIRIAAIILAVIVLILIIVPFALRGKIDEIVKKEIAKTVTATVNFEKLGISLLRHFPSASIELNGLTVVGTDKFEKDTLVSADKISVAVNIMSLFKESGFELSKVAIDKPQIKAIKLADGSVNWNIMRTDSTVVEDTIQSEPSSFKLSIKDVRIDNGKVLFIDDSSSIQFYTDDIKLRLKGNLSAETSDIDMKFSSENIYAMLGKIVMLNRAETEIDMKVEADFKNNKYTLNKNSFKVNAMELSLDGWIALLNDGAIDMDLKLNSSDIKFKDILSMIPAFYTKEFKNLEAKGELSMQAWAKGKYIGDTLPRFAVNLEVKNGGFKYQSLPKSVDNINISLSATNQSAIADNTIINLSNLSLSFAGNSMKSSLHLTNPVSDPNFKLNAVANVNLGAIKEIYPLGDSIKLNGLLDANLQLAGKMSDIKSEKYENMKGEGSFKINNMTTEIKSLPNIQISNFTASVTPSTMALSNLAMKIGDSDIKANGKVSNYLGYALHDKLLSGNLNISSNLLDLNKLMSNDDSTNATTTDSDTTAMTIVEVPQNLNLKLDASLKEVLFQKMKLSNIVGNITIKDGVLSMNRLNMGAMGGMLQASGSYNTAKNASIPELKMSLNIVKASFEETFSQLDMIQKFVPIFQKTGGNYSMTMDMNTKLGGDMQPDLKTLSAKGVLESNDIKIQNIKAFEIMSTLLKNDNLKNIETKDIKIPFSVEDGLIHTSPFNIKMGGINLNLSGVTGLDQSIDYNAKVTLPPMGGLMNLVSNVNVHIGGTFSSPKLDLGLKDMVGDAIKQTIAKEIGNKLSDSGIDLNAEKSKQIEKLRTETDAAATKLVEFATEKGNKLIEQAKNPLAKLAAKASAELMVKEAQKQGDKLKQELEDKLKNN